MKNDTDSSVMNDGNFIEKKYFSWYDYSLFSIMLLLSTMIGIYFGCFGRKQSTAKEYLLGGKTMQALPIAMSLVACHISGITILAIPADIYKFGTNYSLALIGIVINLFLVVYIFLPVFYKLEITSTYEYLKMRFDSKTRILASFLFTLQMMLYLPIVIYIPSLAFAEVTSVNLHLVNPIICAICVFYTTIGGLKAVVWTDTLQLTAMMGAMVVVLIIGTNSTGGVAAIWTKAKEGGRLDIDFDFDPTKRDTFWACLFGWTINQIPHIGVGQGTIQKFLALPSMADIKRSAIVFGIGIMACKAISVCTGLIMYAKYQGCDPFLTKTIKHNDQLLPHYVMDVASDIPGLSGLFIAGIFCAALSTLSASMNSLAGTIYEDFIARFMPKDISQEKVSQILKFLVVIIGIIATSLVFVVERLGGLLALTITFSGVTSGSLLGLFILGMMFPSANAKGAFIGSVSSLIFISWIVIGAQWYKAQGFIKYTPKPLSMDNCTFTANLSLHSNAEENFQQTEDIFVLYRITYYYYTLIGTLVVLIIGLPVSWYYTQYTRPVSKNLITPWMHWAVSKHNAVHQGLNNEKNVNSAQAEEKKEVDIVFRKYFDISNLLHSAKDEEKQEAQNMLER